MNGGLNHPHKNARLYGLTDKELNGWHKNNPKLVDGWMDGELKDQHKITTTHQMDILIES